MLEAFAKFYESLYADVSTKIEPMARRDHSEPITPEEIMAALKKLRPGRSCGDDGLYAEMLKRNTKV